MFSTNLKRSAATLGVVAGVLAGAGSASAAPDAPNSSSLKDTLVSGYNVKAAVGVRENGSQGFVNAPTNAGTQVGSEGVKAPSDAFMHGDFSSVVVKAPTNAGEHGDG
jgi:hypothetical protein